MPVVTYYHDDTMIRIGTSGWSYKHWKGKFYPEGLSQRRWLEYFAEHFETVEINSSFYHIPRENVTAGWAEKTPADFLFSLKMSRLVTHVHKLKDPADTLEWFFKSIKPLFGKVAAILIQLPPSLCPAEERLENFFTVLHRTEERINGEKGGYRYVLEIRNVHCYSATLFNMLKNYRVALCLHDFGKASTEKLLEGTTTANDKSGVNQDVKPPAGFPQPYITSDFIYIRFHGYGRTYGGSYPNDHLKRWADRISLWNREGLDVFTYFNNDAEGFAVQNADTLKGFVERFKD